MRTLLTILSFFWLQTQAGTYYCPDAASFRNRLNTAAPGDFICLLKGQTFTGNFTISKSGAQTAPITIGSYGIATAPVVTGQLSIDGQYVVVDGLNFTDGAMDTTDHHQEANVGVAFDVTGNNNTVRNCFISLVGCAFLVNGDNNIFQLNQIRNLRMIINDDAPDNDYGANAFIVAGSGNKILNNYSEGTWAYSTDYGFDGGFFEVYGGGTSNNTVMYNTVINSNGFSEMGSGDGGVCDNTLIAYNLIINCTDLIYTNSGTYAIAATNLNFYNNTIVETVSQFTAPPVMVSINSVSQISLKNNIFYLMSGVDVARSGIFNQAKNIHENNVYRLGVGSVLGFTIAGSEKFTTAALFTSTSGNSDSWNYMPLLTSAAINAGQWVGIEKDFINTQVALVPDAGIYEFISTTSIPVPTIPIIPIIPPFVTWDDRAIIITSTRFDQYILYDAVGRRLRTGKYKVGRTEIDISRLPHGVYFLRTEFQTTKIIK